MIRDKSCENCRYFEKSQITEPCKSCLAAYSTTKQLMSWELSDDETQSATIARLTAEVEALKDAARWIPVSERLPEVKQLVMVAVKHAQSAKYAQLTVNNTWRTWGGEYVFSSVTHWQPLPQPPEAE